MRNENAEKLGQAVIDVFEKLAFMFGEVIPKEELPSVPGGYVKSSMTFKGPFTGVLAMAVPEEMCVDIAANVLGLEAEDKLARDRASDALKEVLNVICGNALTAIAGPEPLFELTVPDFSPISETEWGALIDDFDSMAFLIDENPALVLFSVGDSKE